MHYEKSAGAIIFYRLKNQFFYLLLDYGNDYWGFPKGRVERGENEKQAAIREIAEETGLKQIKFCLGFRPETRYWFKRKKELVSKKVVYYLAQAESKKIKLSQEHYGFQWLDYKAALKILNYQQHRFLLKKAHGYLIKPKTFSQQVLEVVSQIKTGSTLTYQQVAQKAGRPKAYRAVGNILSSNLDLEVPCHRVIAKDGSLAGYNRGIKTKARLLQQESFGFKIKQKRNL